MIRKSTRRRRQVFEDPGIVSLQQYSNPQAFLDRTFERVDIPLMFSNRARPAISSSARDHAGREPNVQLCPMLSPHTSYPVFDMAACGGAVAANTFATKNRSYFSGISSSILAVEPTVKGFTDDLKQAVDWHGKASVGGAASYETSGEAAIRQPVGKVLEFLFAT